MILLLKNAPDPVRGFLIKSDAAQVEIDELLPSGETRRRVFPRASVDDMLQAVEPARLEQLTPEKPEMYRDYAEELAGKTNDPEAQRMAIRLYQMAATLSPKQLAPSCLLGMVALARTPEEQRKFQAAAYLYHPDHDLAILRKGLGDAGSRAGWNTEQQRDVKRLFRLLHEGKLQEAREFSKRPTLAEPLQSCARVWQPADLGTLKDGPLPPEMLRRVVTAELLVWRRDRPAGVTEDGSSAVPGWARLTDPQLTKPVPVLSLEKLTEFNPQECLFRNGRWVRESTARSTSR